MSISGNVWFSVHLKVPYGEEHYDLRLKIFLNRIYGAK